MLPEGKYINCFPPVSITWMEICNVISLGGDADTMGAIQGVLHGFVMAEMGLQRIWGKIWAEAEKRMPEDLIRIVVEFRDFCNSR